MKNQDVRLEIIKSGLKYWQVADALDISDSTFTKWLRRELEPCKKDMIFSAIERLGREEH